jgi:sugar phosphate isomerase/epimerase
MGTTIHVPYYPEELFEGKTAQLKTIKDMLEFARSRGYQVGIQLYMGNSRKPVAESFLQNPDELLATCRQHIGDALWKNSTIHLPICPHELDERVHLGKTVSDAYFDRMLQAIVGQGIRSAIMHANSTYTLTPGPLQWTEETRRESWRFFDRSVYFLHQFPHLQIAYETMPFPLNEDRTTDPREATIDPHLITRQSLQQFFRNHHTAQNVRKNVSLCLDISHTLETDATLRHLKTHPVLLGDPDVRTLVASLMPTQRQLTPDSEKVRDVLLSLDAHIQTIVNEFWSHSTYVQVSDTAGPWIPKTAHDPGHLITEGLELVPDRGNYDLIAYILHALVSRNPHITISVDVEEDDYVARPRQRRTLQEIIDITRMSRR